MPKARPARRFALRTAVQGPPALLTQNREQLPFALRRALSSPGERPVRVEVRTVLDAPPRAARRILLNWEMPWLAAGDAGVAVRGVDYGDAHPAAPLTPGAMRELVRSS